MHLFVALFLKARPLCTSTIRMTPCSMRMPQLRKRIEDKNKLLQQLAGGVSGSSSSSSSSRGGITFSRSLSLAPIHLVGLDDRWDVFVAQLQDFDGHLDAQRSRLQKQLAVRLEAFESSVAAFASRWGSALHFLCIWDQWRAISMV
jgi:hypothetical protein